VIATLHPNNTWEKNIFDPWCEISWDVNDTVLLDPRIDADIAGFTAAYFTALAAQQREWQSWYERRAGGALGAREQSAASKAAAHADTPTITFFDALDRPLSTLVNNGRDADGHAQLLATRVRLDIEGNQREVIDAFDRIVMRYDYDMLGNRIHRASMEAGERWGLNDAAGKLIYSWDSRDHQFRTTYDPLRRPTDTFLSTGGGAEQLIGRSVYGETQPNPEAKNLRGEVVQNFDQAGVITSNAYDFKGNLLSSSRQLAVEYKTTLNWSNELSLETQIYTSRTSYDAFNRPTKLIAPDNSVIRPTYNEANFLEQVEANLRGASEAVSFVADIDYDAKGRRTLIEYGNGVKTFYEYDPLTFRLTQLQSLRGAERLQDLSYTYDPVGNITHISDDAQQMIYFRNCLVDPSNDYTYDAIYRLIEATGREHLGQTGGQPNMPKPHTSFDSSRIRQEQPGDGNAMGQYVEQYVYDAVGNLLTMRHRGSDPAHAGWTRSYTYEEASLIEPDKASNRLSNTTIGSHNPIVESYSYDAHGNMTRMPHLPLMQWDYRDQLQATSRQLVNAGGTPETTWYVYDPAGQRVRKVTEREATAGQTPTRKAERIYLGAGFEIYREYENDGDTVSLERETLHIMDDKRRIALVETRTQGDEPAPEQLIRYQLGNHLGSASLELDNDAALISYEEYYPYGSTSYQAVHSQIETPKRYRYSGKERDEETGLSYHGARYYAPWIGRWMSCDPSGLRDGANIYTYVNDDPVNKVDLNGNWEISWTDVAIGAGAAILVVGAVALTAGLAAGPIAAGLATAGLTASEISALGTAAVAVGTAAGVAGTADTATELVTGINSSTGRPLTDEEGSRRLGALPVQIVATALGVRGLTGGGGGPTLPLPEPVPSFRLTTPEGISFGLAPAPAAAAPVVVSPAGAVGVGSYSPTLMMSMMNGGESSGGGGDENSRSSGGNQSSNTPSPPSESSAPANPKTAIEALPEEQAERLLYRIARGDAKGRPFGTPSNPRPPTVEEFNPRIVRIRAGDIQEAVTETRHGLFPEQQTSVGRLSNEELLRFRMEDPISATQNPSGGLSLTGGHHRTAEIMRRVAAGELSPDTLVEFLIHD